MKSFLPILLLLSAAGCATSPDLPVEADMPVQSIFNRAACELREAFRSLRKVKGFQADQWAVSISLTPKIDDELSAKLGYSGKNTINPATHSYLTWSLGTTPGAEYDVKGHRDASVAFLVHSAQLIDKDHYPLRCSGDRPEIALMQRLGIYEWLSRLVVSDADGLDKLTKLDKPTYNSEVIIKYDAGAAGPSFIGPYASFNPTLYGSYTRDETLGIAMTPDPPSKKSDTLPAGAGTITRDTFGTSPVTFSQAVRDRLDRIQTDNILKNLTVRPQ